jgi:hypothetical protein
MDRRTYLGAAVFCLTATSCTIACGPAGTSASNEAAQAEQGTTTDPTHTWTTVASPSVAYHQTGLFSSRHGNNLLGAFALSPRNAWAVGYAPVPDGMPGAEATLSIHWNGTHWSIVDTPNSPGAYQNELHSVSASSARDAWAVGFSQWDVASCPAGHLQCASGTICVCVSGLLEHWDGTSWRAALTLPDVQLLSVHAISANDVWAVGGRWVAHANGFAGADELPFILHYDGQQWNRVTQPSVDFAYLSAVSALGPNDVWAVGQGANSPVVLHWDGRSFSSIDFPREQGQNNIYLAAVSGTAPNDVWIVGDVEFPSENTGDLDPAGELWHWDGQAWSSIAYPAPVAFFGSSFGSVQALSTSNVWALGTAGLNGLVYHWDGTAWAFEPLPIDASQSFYALAASKSGDVWTVGQSDVSTPETFDTYTAHFVPKK